MRSAVFTEWFENADGMMVCSPGGQRLDDPEAHLSAMRILFTESGHYIIPNNQQSDYDSSEGDKAKIRQMLQGSSKPYQGTSQEQTGNNIHDSDNHLNCDKNQVQCNNKDKLQFMTDDEKAGNEIHD